MEINMSKLEKWWGKYWSTIQERYHWSCFGRWDSGIIIAIGNTKQVKSDGTRWHRCHWMTSAVTVGGNCSYSPPSFLQCSPLFIFNFFLCWRFSCGIHLKLIPGVRPLTGKAYKSSVLLEIFCMIPLWVERCIPVAHFFVRNFVTRSRI